VAQLAVARPLGEADLRDELRLGPAGRPREAVARERRIGALQTLERVAELLQRAWSNPVPTLPA
jgi:hypothetical protein